MSTHRQNTPLLLIAVLAAMTISQAAKAQIAGQKNTATSTNGSSEIDRFFPLHIGNRWIYRIRKEEAGSGEHTIRVKGKYSETIVEAKIFGSVQIAEVRREGKIHPHIFCGTEQAKNYRFWFIASKNRLFARCSKPDETDLVQSLNEHPDQTPPGDPPEFVLPFAIGKSWGADPDGPPSDNGFYQWNVQDNEAVARHSKFHDCYFMAYQTLPDDEERRVCAGVGLVSDSYNHHGTVDQYDVELVKFIPSVR